MKKIMFVYFPLLFSLGCCPTIPKQTIELNIEIGKSLQSIKKSHIEFVNLYFETKFKQLDKISDDAIKGYKTEIVTGIKTQNINFDSSVVSDIITDINTIMKEKDTHKNNLLKIQNMVIDSILSCYESIVDANKTITSFLTSAKNLTNESQKSINILTGNNRYINSFESIKTEVDKYVSNINIRKQNTIDSIDAKINDILNKARK
jgi:hypothetical protein